MSISSTKMPFLSGDPIPRTRCFMLQAGDILPNLVFALIYNFRCVMLQHDPSEITR